jgi:two-component system sensor kinase FixL
LTGGRIALAAFAVAVVYYVGARLGMALTFAPLPVAVLWPPNALLLAALVIAPYRWWWALIAGAFPAHVLAELQAGVPPAMMLCWFATNVTEALLGASIIRRFGAAGLGTVRSVLVFCCAAVLATVVSSFLDAACVQLLGWGSADYSTLWQARFVSNLLAILTFVPLVLTWNAKRSSRPEGGEARLAEVGCLLAGLLAASTVVFDSPSSDGAGASLLYLPMPFLIWAALRFGPSVSSASYAVVTFLVIWGAAHGRGPFLEAAIQQDAMPIQLFLITLAVPLLLLAAVIEERKKAERETRVSRELFSTAFQSGPDAMAISRDGDGKIIEANERWGDLMGCDSDPSAHPSMAALAHHLDESGRQRIAAAMKEGRGSCRLVEVTLLDGRGHSRIALVSVAAVSAGDESCLISIVRDITKLRQAEKEAKEQRHQLTHLNRVASLSDFSSTIAHELNQPLTAILSNAQAALRMISRDPANLPELRAILGEIVDADKRAALLIQHVRLLMKRGTEEFVPVELNHQVKQVLDLARGEFLLRHVSVNANYSPDLPLVRGDRVQLQQLILNLVRNACEAMEGNRDGNKALSVTTMHGDGQTVQVVVSDTGPGIPAERLESVFEPFLTTKESGLGMGLAICRKIAAVHGGVLSAQSQQGQGATFRLVLPALPGDRDFAPGSTWHHATFSSDGGKKADAHPVPSDSPAAR